MFCRRRSAVALLVFSTLLVAVPSVSDSAPKKGKKAPDGPSGTIEAMVPGYIQVKTATGQLWALQVMPNAKVTIIGTAKADFLQPGHFISFVADVDKRSGVVEAPVRELTLFTPTPQSVMGAFPEGGAMGVAPGGTNKTTGRAAPLPVERYAIAGRIGGVKNGTYAIFAPNPFFKGTVKIKIAEEAAIDLNIVGTNTYSLAKKGDSLASKGNQVGLTALQASELTIELAAPLTAPKLEQPTRRTATGKSRTTRPPAGATPPDEPKEKDGEEAPPKSDDASK